jgi:predicted nucleic acid-binding protein
MGLKIALGTNKYRDFVEGDPVSDLWIASLVLQHDLILYTRDWHFNAITYLPKM